MAIPIPQDRGHEAHSLQTAKHQSFQSTYTQTQLFTGIHSYCSYVHMYMHKVIHATLPDICISPIIAYVKVHTSCMQKHNCKTKLCHSFHEIRFIIKTHIMVRNMIYSLLLLYNCAYTLPITDIRINAEDDDNVCALLLPRHAQLNPCWPVHGLSASAQYIEGFSWGKHLYSAPQNAQSAGKATSGVPSSGQDHFFST